MLHIAVKVNMLYDIDLEPVIEYRLASDPMSCKITNLVMRADHAPALCGRPVH